MTICLLKGICNGVCRIFSCFLGGFFFQKKRRNLPIINPKLDLHNISAHTKFGKIH